VAVDEVARPRVRAAARDKAKDPGLLRPPPARREGAPAASG